MTKQEVAKLLARIQTHYTSLKVDDFMIDEWFKELKDYKSFDVNEKLEKHLRSEEFGKEIPKLYYLIRYLNKEHDDKQPIKGKLHCRLCNEYVDIQKYDKHYERCLDVDYLNQMILRAGGDPIDKIKYRKATDESFEKVYYQTLENCVKKIEDEAVCERILNILKTRGQSDIEVKVENLNIADVYTE